jgi:thiamine pyrophosphokinase
MASPRQSTGLLLLGSAGPPRALVAPFADEAGMVVAADSGFDLAVALGLEPDLVVGDLDSVTRHTELARLPAGRVRRAGRDKALTDAELGLQVLTGQGCKRIIVAGGGGGRFDHQLAVLGLFERDRRLQVWLTAGEHMEAIDGQARFRGQRGCTVSLFPLSGAAEGLSSRGLRWPLDGLCLQRGHASVSNVVVADEWQVGVASGRLLVIRNLARLPIPP